MKVVPQVVEPSAPPKTLLEWENLLTIDRVRTDVMVLEAIRQYIAEEPESFIELCGKIGVPKFVRE